MKNAPYYATGLLIAALALADRAVICDVECEGTRVDDGAPQPVYDISAMFDLHEHTPEFIDMASEGVGYGIARGLFELLPGAPMCVRLLRRSARSHSHAHHA